jgi:hypothetical protein
MRVWERSVVLLLAFAIGVARPVVAAGEKGELKSKVITALRSVAGGQCPADLMAPLLLDQCEKQLGPMKSRLSELGAIKDAEYRGIEQMPNGIEAEVYKVIFVKGSMMWCAAASPNGKLSVLWSPG